MLAWHLPHQLAAELVLVGVSAMVLLYSLLPWGKNQWLRTHVKERSPSGLERSV